MIGFAGAAEAEDRPALLEALTAVAPDKDADGVDPTGLGLRLRTHVDHMLGEHESAVNNKTSQTIPTVADDLVNRIRRATRIPSLR